MGWYQRLIKYLAEMGGMTAKSRPKGTISARVYRARTNTWEDLGVISKPERNH